jgi:pimeloyl-ACP methyl ester carboxylesterase
VRRSTRAAAAVAAGMAGVALGGLAGRRAIRRSRSRPSPERNEPMSERPGVERRVRSFDGPRLVVNVVGPEDGPSIVFVHGFSIDMTGWYFQWRHFSQSYRCVLYDQRGHGRSDRPADGDYSLQALGRDLRAVLDAEVPDGPAVVVGHSMGGMAVMSLAEQFPQEFRTRVRAVVLANTAAGDVVTEAVAGLGARLGSILAGGTARLAANPRAVARIRARAFSGESNLAYAIGRLTNFGANASPALVEHVVRIAAQTPPDVWSDLFVGLLDMDLRHALEHIRVPALVLAGDVDRLTPPAGARAIERVLPDARMVVFEGAGHCTMLERHEEWNEVVEGFLVEVLGDVDTRRAASPATAGS